MCPSFIVFLKNNESLKFEYKSDVSKVARTEKGFLITFSSGKSYNYGADRVRYHPFVSSQNDVRIYEKGQLNRMYNAVCNYGDYLIFRNGDNISYPIKNTADIEICDLKKNADQAELLLNYFNLILRENDQVSFGIPSEDSDGKNSNQISAEMLLRVIQHIDIWDTRSALSGYMDGTDPLSAAPGDQLIYPFGCNESQKLAVEAALSNSLSIVEGPPGTGKTQTILNIIANLIMQHKTVAIVSNNNSAVFNVGEKLTAHGYGMMVAPLGSNSNKALFFGSLEEQTVHQHFEAAEEQLKNLQDKVRHLDSLLTDCFRYRNRFATLKTALSDAEIQFNHIKAEQPLSPHIKSILDKKFRRKLTADRMVKLKDLVAVINTGDKVSILSKLRFVLQYGLLDLRTIIRYAQELPVYVNHKFYELLIAETEKEIQKTESWLKSNNETEHLTGFIEASKKIFNAVLFKKYNRLGKITFTADDYKKKFDEFTARYPVMLSSTLSLNTSIPKGYLFDYLIIDEASQVDMIKAVACLSCCRNAVIVGDSMQLTHIPGKKSKAVAQFEQEHHLPPAYAFFKKNILDSLKSVYGDSIKSVLLKEHYRCHPIIIGFCNKKYYNNNLTIMTSGENIPFKIIETNIAGGRGRHNQRQIDETDLYVRGNHSADFTKVGVVAPYRDHADMLQRKLPPGTQADTIHKFQGREKEVVVFNTVDNKIGEFIDNPNLINVAVSRAVKEFIVVKPASMELPHGTNIGDLIRYICYTTDPGKAILQGRIRSVFDLLYKEYNRAFLSFMPSGWNRKKSPAEIIIHKLLREKILLNNTPFGSIDIVQEYKLLDLVRDFELFSNDEIRFIRNNSRIDFLLYNKIDKTPVLAIEVDGVSFHDNVLQQERDRKKDHILEIIGLPLLRLSTDGHNEEVRIVEKLKTAMGLNDMAL